MRLTLIGARCVPRKTRLALISERPAMDEAAVVNAAVDLARAGSDYQLAPPADVLAQLRHQNSELARLAAESSQRADQAEAALHQAASDRETASREVKSIREQAAKAIDAAMTQGAVAEKTALATERVRQTVGVIGSLVSFLVERAPVLATLMGAYFLARDMLPDPGAMQLGLLGIYGATAVLPATYWSLRRG